MSYPRITETLALFMPPETTLSLQKWLTDNCVDIADATMNRLPNRLISRGEVTAFLRLMLTELRAAPENQLAAIQFWAITEIGYDAPAAGDWRTILRILKQETVIGLEETFTPSEALQHWRQLDDMFTYAIIEVTQLASDIDHAIMLEHVVNLRRQTEKLEETKSKFVMIAAHELKTPLTILEGYAKMLVVETKEQPHLDVYLKGLQSGIRRMRELITDLLDISLLDLRTMEVDYHQFYLEKILLVVADSVNPSFAERNVKLILKPFAIQKRIYGDSERLMKAFTKVIMNALKYTPDGGTVTVSSELQSAGEPIAGSIEYIDIQIKDTGIGINPEDLEMIFHKFNSTSDVKLHSTSKTKFKGDGPGLGLPIAKGIIEAHGGRIWAESPGHDESNFPGCTFHIELPLLYDKP
ncbi:MAG: HAMP domain-containing sensor histidine kinase [Chloroflexota bacterium]